MKLTREQELDQLCSILETLMCIFPISRSPDLLLSIRPKDFGNLDARWLAERINDLKLSLREEWKKRHDKQYMHTRKDSFFMKVVQDRELKANRRDIG